MNLRLFYNAIPTAEVTALNEMKCRHKTGRRQSKATSIYYPIIHLEVLRKKSVSQDTEYHNQVCPKYTNPQFDVLRSFGQIFGSL
jgi:hypothetical protein